MLSPELLLQIFDYAHSDDRRHGATEYSSPSKKTLSSILLVCKAWNSLAERLLYRQISLQYGDSNTKSIHNESVHDSLRRYPYRRRYVEDLMFRYSSQYDMGCDQEILDIIHGMCNLKTVDLFFDWAMSPIKCAIAKQLSLMPKIANLALNDASICFVLEQIAISEVPDVFSGLKRLSVNLPWSLQECKIPTSRWHTSKLEDLYICGNLSHAINLELLKWPRALKKLCFQYGDNDDVDIVAADRFQRVLNLQSSSLEEIEYPVLDCDSDLPDLTRFPSLTRLKLSHHAFFGREPRIAVERSCPPALETLIFDMEDRFDNVHADWLLEFARCYQNLSRTKSLKTIHMDYFWTVGYNPYFYQQPFEAPWPNACMTVFKPKLAELGLDLT